MSAWQAGGMALNIEDPETGRLARELAAETGESLAVAVKEAIEERLERVRARSSAAGTGDPIAEVIARGRRRAVLDGRSVDAIIGYDDDGLPT